MMQTELLSISKIFTENLYRIPDFQRGYAWGEKQLRDFWNDLEQLEEGKFHYTGVLTFEQVPPAISSQWDEDLWIIQSKRYSPYYVVDGQQRLTTIVILLQVILEISAEGTLLNYSSKDEIRKKYIFESKDGGISRSYLFGYAKDNPSYQYLKKHIYNESPDSHSPNEETIYTHNLSYAKDFFHERLNGAPTAKVEKLFALITQRLLFNIYTISGEIDVFVTFETMNNRGKPLSHLELLKNRLIYLSTKFKVEQVEKDTLRSVINESWKSVYHYLGKNKNQPLSDNEFLQTHFFLYFGPTLPIEIDEQRMPGEIPWRFRRATWHKDHLLEEIFTSKQLTNDTESPPSLTVDSLYKYAKSIKDTVETYYQIFNPAESPFLDEEKIQLERLQRLDIETDDAVLITAILQKFPSSPQRANILSLLERLNFLNSIARIREDADELDELELGVQVISGRLGRQDLVDLLERSLSTAMGKTKFAEVFATWAKRYGYYGWKGIKYFMFEYEQELLQKSKNKRQKLIWNDFANEDYNTDFRTVEHIYPQKVEEQCWKEVFNQYSVKQRNILRNSIGNLVPLSKSKNSSLQNKCFNIKKGDAENKVGYAYGCYSEIEVSQCASWTPVEILQRGIALLEFMEHRWGFVIGDRNAKVRALGLQFLEKAEAGRKPV